MLTGTSHILCVFGTAFGLQHVYTFTIGMQQSIHMHATIIEYTEARGPIYKMASMPLQLYSCQKQEHSIRFFSIEISGNVVWKSF